MKLKSLLLVALAALFTLAAPRPARALEVSFDFFHDSLSPYGEWMEVGDYGYCWRPAGVDEEWSPYSDGYWSYTDAGWTWVSYEEFGGIVYHYGRWVKVEDEGWVWVPDYEWGPAWVSWRKNDDYVGWAPLPAEAHWHRERGISVWADTSYDIGPASYSFCRYHDFGAPVLRPVIIRRSENIVIINNTVNITNITYNTNAGYIFNGGLDYAYVNRFSRRQIPALKLVRNTNYTVVNNHIVNNNVRVTNFNSVQRGNQLTIIAPTVVRPQPAQVTALLQPKVTKVIAQNKVTKGWGGVPAEQRTVIRTKLQQETEGKTPETMSAKPIAAAELKVVPVKADPKAKLPTVNRNVPAAPPAPVAVEDKKTPEAITKVPGVVAEPAKTAVEKVPGRKPGKMPLTPPADAQTVTENPPPAKGLETTPKPIARERPQPVRPGIVKPFNPPVDDNAPAGAAIEKRNAAAEAAKAQAAARQRAMEEKNQQQEIARQNNAQEAAAARQRVLQQQQQQKLQQSRQEPPEQPVAPKRAAQAEQMQQNQQQQILRERAAQAAEARSRNAEAQQSQAASARQQALERAQAQAAARQQAAGAAQNQPQRNMPPAAQQRNVPPAAQPQQRVPAKPGKKPLTPEEAAAAAQQQQLR